MNSLLLLLSFYFLVINAIAFFFIVQDKGLAQKNAGKEQRFSEGIFFLFAIIGGSIGVYLGMITVRHKTQKISFFVGIPLLFLQQALLLWLIFYK